MGFLALLNHVLNFVLPALCLATVLVLLVRVPWRKPALALGWRRHWLALFGSGVAVLLAGLLLGQQDGRMLTYISLALVCGLVQGWLLRRYPAA